MDDTSLPCSSFPLAVVGCRNSIGDVSIIMTRLESSVSRLVGHSATTKRQCRDGMRERGDGRETGKTAPVMASGGDGVILGFPAWVVIVVMWLLRWWH